MIKDTKTVGPAWGRGDVIKRKSIEYCISDVVCVSQGDRKMVVLQRIEHTLPVERLEFRFAYYRQEAAGSNSTGAQRWMFGQSALFIPAPEMTKVFAEAAKRWPEFRDSLAAAMKEFNV